MSLRLSVFLIAVAGVIGAGLGARYATKQTQIVTHETVKDRIVTVTKTIKQKDGSEVTTQTSTEDKKEQVAQVATVAKPPPQWMVSGIYGAALQPYYGASVQRRVLGPVFIGAGANSRQELQLQLSLEF